MKRSIAVLLMLFSLIIFSDQVNANRYTITVTREDQDFYHIDGTDLYVETFACFEFVFVQSATLNITSPAGVFKGTIQIGSATYQVKNVYQSQTVVFGTKAKTLVGTHEVTKLYIPVDLTSM